MRYWRQTQDGFRELEKDTPEPTGSDVRVAVEAVVFGETERRASGDVTPGGASVGRVEACGDAASHLAGARVLVGPAAPCGECDACRRGAAASCPRGHTLGATVDGALATHVIAPARWVCPLVEGLDLPGPVAALAARELPLAYAMLARAGVGPGEPVVIAGDGVVSRLCFAVAVERGTTPIVATRDDAFAAAITTAGGRAVFGDDLGAEARRAASELQLGERPWKIFVHGADPEAGARALSLLGPGATLTVGGADDASSLSLSLSQLAALGATALGVAHAHPDLLTEAAALVATGAIDLADYAEVRALSELAGSPRAAPGRAIVLVP